MENDARTNLQTAKDAQAAREVASAALGDSSPATGARAVLATATVTKDAILAQQAFHTARVTWATDNLKPIKATYDAVVLKIADLESQRDTAMDVLAAAKHACKVKAFEDAQEARVKAQEVAAARADKVAAVKKDYDALAEFATDGTANTLCHYKTPAEGEAQ